MNNTMFVDIHTHKSSVQPIAVINLSSSFISQPSVTASGVFFSIGLHPWFLDDWEQQMQTVSSGVTNPAIAAIGECGMDPNARFEMKDQMRIFEQHILLSESVKKPLIIHCVKVFQDLFRIKNKYKPQMPWIVHGFNNRTETGMQCIRNGLILSFGKSLFNERSGAFAMVKDIKTENFFLETDDSDYAIDEIYTQCAKLRGTSVEQLKTELCHQFKYRFAF